MSYTPGAWKYIPWHIAEDQPQVLDGDGNMICYTASDDNARLIASAPELLDACVAAANMLIATTPGCTAVKMCLDAIARAEGK